MCVNNKVLTFAPASQESRGIRIDILSGQHEQGDYYNPDFIENGKRVVEQGYVTDIVTDKAIEYLEHRDKSRPFCMMFHQKAPHRNWMPALVTLKLLPTNGVRDGI